MAYDKVLFGDKEVALRASAATTIYFKRIFHFDPIITMLKIKEKYGKNAIKKRATI